MASMTSRERVLTALEHQEPDRVPFIFGVDLTTGIMRRAYKALTKHLEIEVEEQYMYGTWKELGDARVDEQVLRILGSDGRGVWDRKPTKVEELNQLRDPHESYQDEFGVGQVKTGPEEWFPGIHPFEQASLDALETYPWPDMGDPTCFIGIRQRAEELDQQGEFAVFAAPWLISPFERAMQLQGMERFLSNMILEPDFAQALLEKLTALLNLYLENFLAAVDHRADIVILADDLGTQDRLLISPTLYRQMLKPLHAQLISTVKQASDARVFFHSDGDIFDLIDDLVEIGIDILNPIQTTAGQMANLDELKRRYGTQLSFCGGIDTQTILPYGSPEDVAAEVRRVIQALGPGGGYLVASVHTITNNIPPENIIALARAVEEYGPYPIG
jgi:uroporphyrinogen decarboxylase